MQAAVWGFPSLRTTQSRLITALRRSPDLRTYSFECEFVSVRQPGCLAGTDAVAVHRDLDATFKSMEYYIASHGIELRGNARVQRGVRPKDVLPHTEPVGLWHLFH
jgi:hypothetical protein